MLLLVHFLPVPPVRKQNAQEYMRGSSSCSFSVVAHLLCSIAIPGMLPLGLPWQPGELVQPEPHPVYSLCSFPYSHAVVAHHARHLPAMSALVWVTYREA